MIEVEHLRCLEADLSPKYRGFSEGAHLSTFVEHLRYPAVEDAQGRRSLEHLRKSSSRSGIKALPRAEGAQESDVSIFVAFARPADGSICLPWELLE
jgi:hypothetical protein